MRRVTAGVVVLAAVLAGAATAASDEAPPLFRTAPDALGAPFDGWGVVVTPDADEPNLLSIEFDSAAVGQRVTSLVWLPTAYGAVDADFPVAYYLHGQGDANTFDVTQQLSDAGVPAPYPFARPEASTSFGGIDPAGSAGERSFLLVGIDNGPVPWCGHCWFVDSIGDGGVDAERHLLDEVIPLVEALFRVRPDRGGRAILGNSMGANGSLLVGFRHPDTFAFVGALSPTYPDLSNRALFEAWTNFIWQQYVADQGYPPPPTAPVLFEALDPLFYAAAVNAAGTEIVTAIGDGCLPNDGAGACAGEPPTGDPDQEVLFRRTFDTWAQAATEAGVRFTNVQREGAHSGTLNHDNFVRYFLPRMNELFATTAATPLADPPWFSYRTVDRSASIFGWDLAVDRPNVETLHLLGARTDGTEITLAGSGLVTVTTPPTAGGAGAHRVVATLDGGTPVELSSTTGDDGRVRFTVDLGPVRDVDERGDLVETGVLQFPHTVVRIEPAP